MNRIILEPTELAPERVVTLTDHRARHIATILKPALGQPLRIGVVNGDIGTGVVRKCSRDRVTLECQLTGPPPPQPHICLLLALPRPKIMKRLWAPLASLGVQHIHLTNAAAVERNYFDTHWIEETHYRPHLLEGLAQAGITRLPCVSIHRQLKPFIEDNLETQFAETTRLLAHPTAEARIRNAIRPQTRRVLLAIGPEGGWTPYECDLLTAHGFIPVATGHEVLRSDVACIALLSLAKESMAP
ncbi:MAG: RsmE family RNA methyltransferase [Verrucomicrobia bacterium]|nr:RsmE family RNA methyltransferase [Verrucomicrobiota bacterium]